MAKSRRPTDSASWFHDHVRDPYVRAAQKSGYRSRASYKLLHLQERHRLLKPGMRVIDLGAAPGGWSQVAHTLVGRSGQVVALDRLPMDPLKGVQCLQADFTNPTTQHELTDALAGHQADGILSDMAPNLTGVIDADQMNTFALNMLVLDFAKAHLSPKGWLLLKAFEGSQHTVFVKALKNMFQQVTTCKPDASRARSRELYLLAKTLKLV